MTVDIEHTHTDIHTAALMFGAIADAGCVPLARVTVGRHDVIKSVLDCGAMGIVAPMVMDAAEARTIVEATLYPPRGNRSVGGGLHALNYGTSAEEYFRRADDEILVVIQTEHVAAVEVADETYSVPGVDAVFVGPNDLAASLRGPDGTPPSKQLMESTLTRIREAAARQKIASGASTSSRSTTPESVSWPKELAVRGGQQRVEVHAPGRLRRGQGVRDRRPARRRGEILSRRQSPCPSS